MCNLKPINKSVNGALHYCEHRNMYQLIFNNLIFDLNAQEMSSFNTYINQIDIDYWESEYRNSIYDKKIPIPTLQPNFIILLNRNELEELRYLVQISNEYKLLRPCDIEYIMVQN